MRILRLSEPTTHTETEVALVKAPALAGRVETMAAEMLGSWTELAAELQVPTAWGSAVDVRVYTVSATGAQRVAEFAAADIEWQTGDAGALRVRLRVSGELSQGFRVTFVSSATPPAGKALVELFAWQGSAAAVGQAKPATASTVVIVEGDHTPGAADANPTDAVHAQGFCFGWDDRLTMWRRLLLDPDSNLFVSGSRTPATSDPNPTDALRVQGFSYGWSDSDSRWHRLQLDASENLLVAGDQEIPDGDATPTDAVNAAAFTLVYDEGNDTWWRARGNSQGFAYVACSALSEDGTGTVDLACTPPGVLYMTPGLPSPAASTNDPSDLYSALNAKRVKAAAGKVVGITANNNSGANLYFCIVDKASGDPANTDTVRFAWLVPASGCVSRELMRPLPCATGIGFAWSTTASAVTLAAAPGSAAVQFV